MSPEDIQNIKNRFGIIGNDDRLNRAVEVAYKVASTDLSVLVTGESGVGKEFFPKIIHQFSGRKTWPVHPSQLWRDPRRYCGFRTLRP